MHSSYCKDITAGTPRYWRLRAHYEERFLVVTFWSMSCGREYATVEVMWGVQTSYLLHINLPVQEKVGAFFPKRSFYHLSGLQCIESKPMHEKNISLIQLQFRHSKLMVPNNSKTWRSVRKQAFRTTVKRITNPSSPWPLTYSTTPFPLHHIDYLILWQTLSTLHSCSWM